MTLEFLLAREHGYLRSGHVTEATSPVEVLTTSLSLHFTMGPLKCVISDSFCRGEEDSRFYLPLVCCNSFLLFPHRALIQFLMNYCLLLFIRRILKSELFY